MKIEEIAEYCAFKEEECYQNITFSNLEKSKLKKQEMLIEIKDSNFRIINAHDTQDRIRMNYLNFALNNSGIDFSKINFKAIINLDDDVPDFESDAPRICLSKRKGHGNILIPDSHCFALKDHKKNIDQMRNKIDFDKKINQMIFSGSDTGVFKCADKNQRFQFCLNNKDKGNFKITQFVEIEKNSLNNYDWQSVASDRVSIEDHLKFKFILNINGNTTSWERLLWVMYSDSLCVWLKPQAEQMSWYYHMFDLFGGPVMVSENDWEDVINFYIKNESFAKHVCDHQTNLASNIMNDKIHLLYLKLAIERYNKQYNS